MTEKSDVLFDAPGLLIVDLQRDLVARTDASIHPWAQAPLERIAMLLAAFRQHGLPVVWVRTAVRRDGRDAPVAATDRSQGRPAQRGLVDGTPGAGWPLGFDPLEREDVVTKPRTSAFHQTRLALTLRSNNVREIVLCGGGAQRGVASTLWEAADHGYPVALAAGCIADPNPAAVTHLEQCSQWGVATVMSPHELIAGL